MNSFADKKNTIVIDEYGMGEPGIGEYGLCEHGIPNTE